MTVSVIDKERETRAGKKIYFFQAEDSIRDAQESRRLGDVYRERAVTRTRG